MVTYFFFDLGDVDWNTLLAVIRFSMYWPRTWFSDFSLRFSSFTVSTLEDKSRKKKNYRLKGYKYTSTCRGSNSSISHLSNNKFHNL